MQIVDIIASKRDGRNLSAQEIEFFVQGYVQDQIPDYQMAALLMAIFLRGMSWTELIGLTRAMMHSGQVLDLSAVGRVTVDKHSTGGVGDKVSLVVAPLVAAAGVPVPMLSGRGLGHTGGTLDKLESIPGFRTDLTPEEFIRRVREVRVAIMGQSADIAPADGKLYALRDVTATVSSLPLIASSIMSKKLAAGADALVFDVKIGRGAVLPEEDRARQLAHLLNRIGKAFGRRTVALLTRMDQPLGRAVGNAVEVAEAIDCLRGEGPADLLEVTMALGAEMLILGGAADNGQDARQKLSDALSSGKGLETLRDMIHHQGGDQKVVVDTSRLPRAALRLKVESPVDGYIHMIDAQMVGQICVRLGAGRGNLRDRVDPAVGVIFERKRGELVSRGQVVAWVMANEESKGREAVRDILEAMIFGEEPPRTVPLIVDRLAWADEDVAEVLR